MPTLAPILALAFVGCLAEEASVGASSDDVAEAKARVTRTAEGAFRFETKVRTFGSRV